MTNNRQNNCQHVIEFYHGDTYGRCRFCGLTVKVEEL